MIIKQLILDNFQKHEHLVLDFDKGVNVLYGKTDVGKSCIIRSLRFLFYPSELRGDVVRREGSKRTSVKATLDNGAIIERIKTATTNSYKLTIGEEVKEWNAAGNTLPEEIQKIIKFKPIEIDNDSIILNVSNQLSMPFLLDKSGTFRQKLFNKLTGNDAIDKIFQDLNKDILQIGRDERTEKERIGELTTQLEITKKNKDKVESLSISFGKLFANLKSNNDRYGKLVDLLNNLNEVEEELRVCSEKIRTIRIIDKEKIKLLEQKINRFDNLVDLQNKLKQLMESLTEINFRLNKIVIPKIDTKELNRKIDLLFNLQKLSNKLGSLDTTKQQVIVKLAEINPEIEELDRKYKKLLKEMDICPFYKLPCPLNKGEK